jgi:anti-sigma regulatory factor (Ser/Thr protein kinase)
VHCSGHTADLCHPALVYATPDQFLAAAVPFLRDGIALGEPCLAVTSARNVALLREALGPDHAATVDLQPADVWLSTPWRALVAYRRWVERHSGGASAIAPQRRVRVLGEPFAPGRTTAAAREWTRYEALLNVAFAALPLTLLCSYDAAALPRAALDDVLRSHPQLLEPSQQLRDNPGFAEPRSLFAALDAVALEPVPSAVAEQPVDSDLHALRGFVAAQAQRAGVPGDRIPDVTLAAHEVAANACTHGGGDAVLRAWTTDGEFLCEVADHGAGMRDPLAGNVEPAVTQPSGRGLWLARQLCDLVQVRTGAAGTTVRLHLTLG